MTISTRISIPTNLCPMPKIKLLAEAESFIAFSTERGAAATPDDPYSGFSACHYTGDSGEHVAACRAELADLLGISAERLVIPRQTHSDRVAVIDSVPVSGETVEGIDALVTKMRDVALCINTADCVPVLLHDSEAGVAAAAHCGWRGTVNDLLPKTLAAMERLGAHPKNIRAYMGPSICRDCFEVGEDVASVFREVFPQEEGIVIDGAGKPHVDLGRAIACRLMRGGVRMENISEPSECSRCNPQRFFSARALGIESGRTLSAVMMRL